MNERMREEGADTAMFAMPSVVAAAHELKSPLALIRQLSLSVDDEMNANELRRIARQLELTSDRALRLIDDVTQAQRLEDGLFDLEPINPVALCEDVVRELQPLYKAQQRSLRVRRRRNPPLVVANYSLLRRVVAGFVDNALHYTFDAQPVVIETHSAGDTVRISVRDRGPGVSGSLQNSLRTATPKLQSPSRRPSSSGLGLYIARQFAEAMHGKVGVIRHRDGASFYVELSSSTQMSWL